jgi:hypothetical protein
MVNETDSRSQEPGEERDQRSEVGGRETDVKISNFEIRIANLEKEVRVQEAKM